MLFSGRWLTIILLVIALSVTSMASLALRNEANLPNTPLTEDGFYSLTVARNLAMGNGLTIDGSMLTNGFQPLYTIAVAAPVYFFNGGDRIESLRWLFVVNTFIIILTALALGSITYKIAENTTPKNERLSRALLCVLIYLTAAGIWRFHYNGLETGFLLFMYTLTWLYYQRIGTKTFLRAAGMGILLGLLMLTRIDAAFFALVVIFFEGISRSLTFGQRIIKMAAIGIPALIISTPWFTYNYYLSGSIQPSSGIAQSKFTISFDRLVYMFEAICEVLTPFFYFGQWEGVWSTLFRLILITFVITLCVSFFRKRNETDGFTKRSYQFAKFLAATYCILIIWYLSNSVATWFYPRYLAPLSLLAVMATVLVIDNLSKPLRVYCVSTILVLSLQIPLFIYWHHSDKVFRGSMYYNDELKLVQANVPVGVKIGAHESGTLGYFRDGVLNLDGKVNIEVIKKSTDLSNYLDQKGIEWLVTRAKLTKSKVDRGWVKVASKQGSEVWYLYHKSNSKPAIIQ